MSDKSTYRSPLKRKRTSKALLYSEYLDITDAEHAIKLIENKKKIKPNMLFQRSSVLERVNKLLPLLKQSQREFNEKTEENNIEVIDGNSFIEMNVALLEHQKENSELTSDSGEIKYDENSPEFLSYQEQSENEFDSLETENNSSVLSETSNSDAESDDNEIQNILEEPCEKTSIMENKQLIAVIENEHSNGILKSNPLKDCKED